MKQLSPRQQSILNRVVDTYIETAQPVGSHFITNLYTELYSNSYSPATVRHEMGLLEEMGYLTHPHPSAGRIPTHQGYRYYVDHSLLEQQLPEELLKEAQALSQAPEEVEAVAGKTLEILSRFSGEVSLFLISPVDSKAQERIYPKLFVQGSSSMVEKPEFQDLKKLKSLLRALEEKLRLSEWLKQQTPASGLSVSIGEENEPEAFKNCSVITTKCVVNGRFEGILAMIGPCRMKYSYTIPLVVKISQIVSQGDSRRESHWVL